jgi:hypothetical protein
VRKEEGRYGSPPPSSLDPLPDNAFAFHSASEPNYISPPSPPCLWSGSVHPSCQQPTRARVEWYMGAGTGVDAGACGCGGLWVVRRNADGSAHEHHSAKRFSPRHGAACIFQLEAFRLPTMRMPAEKSAERGARKQQVSSSAPVGPADTRWGRNLTFPKLKPFFRIAACCCDCGRVGRRLFAACA